MVVVVAVVVGEMVVRRGRDCLEGPVRVIFPLMESLARMERGWGRGPHFPLVEMAGALAGAP
eukprot:500524-Amorphochlora_amoeboformis.AAC.1